MFFSLLNAIHFISFILQFQELTTSQNLTILFIILFSSSFSTSFFRSASDGSGATLLLQVLPSHRTPMSLDGLGNVKYIRTCTQFLSVGCPLYNRESHSCIPLKMFCYFFWCLNCVKELRQIHLRDEMLPGPAHKLIMTS